ncbi:MAG: hypothetical protein Q4F28_16010, partial [Eubacteriales bacterium]|nr:hypothetical protein [Eubacteriales bacterium]
MEYVYIGIFGTILSWVFEKILSPVFEFISNLLSKVLSWLFNSILKPLLIEVLWPLIEDTLDLLVETLAEILYSLYAGLLKMIDTMNSAFNYFVGLSDVTYNNQKMPLLDAMFQIDGLRTGFLLISCMGLSIAGLLAVIAVIQSTLDLDFENKRPVSRVLSACLKSFFQLLTVEFVVVFMVKLSGLILKGVDQAVGMVSGSGESTTLARMIFVVSSMNAARDKKWNLNGDNAAQVGITDKIRAPFYSVSDPKNLSYADIDKVGESFYFSKFDYLIGFALAIFLLIVMACCMVVFVQRIFDMMVLYLVSPLFVGMIPLDDGERFGKWREMFIGKCFSGFGMVMTMKLYIMLCPSIMSSSLEFSNSTELNYLTKMVFLLGGAWAVLKSGNMITSLISQGVGYSEQQTSGAVMTMGLTGMTMAGGMAFRGMQLAGGAVGKAAGKTAGRSKQAFSDSKYRPSGGSETTAGKIPGIAENVGGTGGTSGGSGGTGGTSVGTGGTG